MSEADPVDLARLREFVAGVWASVADARVVMSLEAWPGHVEQLLAKLTPPGSPAIGVRCGELFVGYRFAPLDRHGRSWEIAEATSFGRVGINMVDYQDGWQLDGYQPVSRAPLTRAERARLAEKGVRLPE
jgi:hypothetical protein